MSRTSDEILPVYEVSGSSFYEIGYSYGKQLKSRVNATAKLYLSLFHKSGQKRHGNSESQISNYIIKFANDLEKFLLQWCPHIVDEIKGISEGSNVPKWQIYMINARTELINLFKSESNEPECSCIMSRRGNILSQNWDWIMDMQKYIVILRYDLSKIKNNKVTSFMAMIEPGMVGKTGFNNYGIGVTLMLLLTTQLTLKSLKEYNYKNAVNSVPIHILMRLMLECDSFNTVLCRLSDKHINNESESISNEIKKYPIYTYSCLGISDSNQNGIFFECCGKITDIVFGFEHDFTAHTNHYLGCGMQYIMQKSGNSFERMRQLRKKNRNLIITKALHKVEEMKIRQQRETLAIAPLISNDDNFDLWVCKVLLTSFDTGNWNYPVLKPYIDDPESGISNLGFKVGTVCTILMDLNKLTMYISKGNPVTHPFICLPLKTDKNSNERGETTFLQSRL